MKATAAPLTQHHKKNKERQQYQPQRPSKKPFKKSMVYVVVGAGIAGLSAAHEIQKRYHHCSRSNSKAAAAAAVKVIILEKNDRPGGRMQTQAAAAAAAAVPCKPTKQQRGSCSSSGVLFERGAWRVQGNGSKAETLIRTMGGTLIPLRPRPFQEEHVSDEDLMERAGIQKKRRSGLPTNTTLPPGLSVYDACCLSHGLVSEDDCDKGYHGLSDRAIGTRSYSTGGGGGDCSNGGTSYYSIAEGWYWVIEQLAKGLDIRYGNLFVGYDGTKVYWKSREEGTAAAAASPSSKSATVHSMRVNGCVVAIPPSAFPRDDRMLQMARCSVNSHKLCHVWFYADRDVTFVDFKNSSYFSQVIANTTRTARRSFRQQKQQYRLVQIYACDRDALMWLHLYQTSPLRCLELINQNLQKFGFPFRASSLVDVAYWEHAVHSWKPVSTFVSAVDAANHALHPDSINRPSLVVCGEAFSNNSQGWADGALETSEKAVGILLSQVKGPKKTVQEGSSSSGSSKSPDFVYNNYPVTLPKQWYRNHPGGKQALLNHMKENITGLWDIIHSSSDEANATLWHCLLREKKAKS